MAYGSTTEYTRPPQWLSRRVKLWLHRKRIPWVVVVHYQDRVTVGGTRCKAATEWAESYQSADMYFAKWFYEESDEATIDHLICHELDHLVWARAYDVLKEYVGDDTVVMKAFIKAAETAHDTEAHTLIRAYLRKRS